MSEKLESTVKQIQNIKKLARIEGSKHFNASSRKRNYSLWFAIPIIIINVLISSKVFLDLMDDMSQEMKALIGVMTLTSALLVAVGSYLKFDRVSVEHSIAGN